MVVDVASPDWCDRIGGRRLRASTSGPAGNSRTDGSPYGSAGYASAHTRGSGADPAPGDAGANASPGHSCATAGRQAAPSHVHCHCWSGYH